MSKEEISKLSPEQQEKAKEYRDRYFQYAISTEKCDRQRAEKALTNIYRSVNLERKKNGETPLNENPQFIWVDSPYAGAKVAAKLSNPKFAKVTGEKAIKDFIKNKVYDQIDETSGEFKESLSSQGSLASYGSFEAYWVCFYDFVSTELKDENKEMVENLREVVQNCGVYWSFQDIIVISEKPVKLTLNEDKKLHDTEDLAVKFKDGTGMYVINGVKKESLVECALDGLYENITNKMVGE